MTGMMFVSVERWRMMVMSTGFKPMWSDLGFWGGLRWRTT